MDTSFHAVVGRAATIILDSKLNAKAIANAVKSVKSFVTNMAENLFASEDELCLMAA